MACTDSTDIIDIPDSDTDAGSSEQDAKSTARASRTQRAVPASDSVLVIESSDSDDYWSDSDDPSEFLKALERLDLDSGGAPSSTIPSKASSPTRLSTVVEVNNTIVLTSSDDESSPMPFPVQKENTKVNIASTSKSPSYSATTKVQGKRAAQKQVVSTQTRDLDKVDAKLHREVNKLVTDKKSTVKDFTVEISRALRNSPFVNPFRDKLAPHDGKLEFFEPPSGIERLIRFRRSHVARYDIATKEWVLIDPYTRLEDLYILFLPADQLVQAVSEQSLSDMLSVLRDTHQLTQRSQIFLMVDGINAYYKQKGGAKVKRGVIESSMTFLQAVERCFIVHVDGPEDASQWLFDMTGDLVKCGTSKSDTYKNMLQQIHGITESAADGIVEEVPTLRSLFEGYDQEKDMYVRHERLKQVTISNRKDGVAKSRILNQSKLTSVSQALSKKIHDVMWGQDPLTLVL
ncbi:hypothetical protein FRC07_003001 [Ceratobasidium sp. 392]|nr:hypothetical protein FRC07_003001 [Ceratobasidium sp. 392]